MQAMNLISIAQQSGDVSLDLYAKYASQGPIAPPAISGVDQLVAKLHQETQNPFTDDANGWSAPMKAPTMDKGNIRPPVLGIPAGPSPRSSQVCRIDGRALQELFSQLHHSR